MPIFELAGSDGIRLCGLERRRLGIGKVAGTRGDLVFPARSFMEAEDQCQGAEHSRADVCPAKEAHVRPPDPIRTTILLLFDARAERGTLELLTFTIAAGNYRGRAMPVVEGRRRTGIIPGIQCTQDAG